MNHNKGFTMIELMMVVVVIGILAAIAIQQYSSQQAAAKTSEVAPMFAEIKKSQYAYKAEYGQFLSTGSSESDLYPVLGADEPKKKDWNPSTASNWYKLGVNPQTNQVYCGYVSMAGSAGTAPSGTWGAQLFSAGTPQKPWFYMVAECDLDATSGTNTTFITSSELSDVQKKQSGN